MRCWKNIVKLMGIFCGYFCTGQLPSMLEYMVHRLLRLSVEWCFTKSREGSGGILERGIGNPVREGKER